MDNSDSSPAIATPPAPKITPTVGRMIDVFIGNQTPLPEGFITLERSPAEPNCTGPYSGRIASVQAEDRITVEVLDAEGKAFPFPSVHIYGPALELPYVGVVARWMPYQVGQAQKTDDVAAKLVGELKQALEEKIEAAVKVGREVPTFEDLAKINQRCDAIMELVKQSEGPARYEVNTRLTRLDEGLGKLERVVENATEALDARLRKLEASGLCAAAEALTRATAAIKTPGESIDIDFVAGEIHREWLAGADRSYSPFNKPWQDLTVEQRAQTSRQTAGVVQFLQSRGHLRGVKVIDIYAG